MSLKHVLLLFAVAFLEIGCRDVSGPASAASGERPVPVLDRVRFERGTVDVLRRLEPVGWGQRASALIGPEGGEISLPGAGLRVSVPAGALSTPTTITVTARKGFGVAYSFQPHGLTFNKPISVTQDLRRTTAAYNPRLRASLEGGYFEDETAAAFNESDETATVTERIPTRSSRDRRSLTFGAMHFSGYLVASGFVDDDPKSHR